MAFKVNVRLQGHGTELMRLDLKTEKKNVFTCREPYLKLQCRINEEKNDENKYIVKCNPETGEKAQGTSS